MPSCLSRPKLPVTPLRNNSTHNSLGFAVACRSSPNSPHGHPWPLPSNFWSLSTDSRSPDFDSVPRCGRRFRPHFWSLRLCRCIMTLTAAHRRAADATPVPILSPSSRCLQTRPSLHSSFLRLSAFLPVALLHSSMRPASGDKPLAKLRNNQTLLSTSIFLAIALLLASRLRPILPLHRIVSLRRNVARPASGTSYNSSQLPASQILRTPRPAVLPSASVFLLLPLIFLLLTSWQ